MVPIVYEDEQILVVIKPAGMLSHFASKSNLKDLLTEIKHPNYHIITRLDANTEGLVLIAKNSEASHYLSMMANQKQITKKYLAIACGYFDKTEDTIKAYLLKDSENSVVRLSNHQLADAKEIITKYTVLKESKGLSQVEIELMTGKTHQIRAHLAHIGHPLLGDPLYGNKRLNQQMHEKTQLLLSYSLSFRMEDPSNPFYYLNGKTFVVPHHKIIHYFK